MTPLTITYMNENTTIDKMRRMRMNTMADLYHASLNENLYREMHLDDFIATVIDAEWEARRVNRQQKVDTLF